MSKHLFLICFLLSCAWASIAQQETVTDKWLAFVRYANLEHNQIKPYCAHFPSYDYSTKDADFTARRTKWMQSYPKEVEAFLTIPKVKQFNPSMVDLGLKKLGEDNTTVKFEHTYWNMFLRSGLSKEQLMAFAPHFPFPLNTSDIQGNIIVYDKAFTDFTILFPAEFVAFMNHEEVRKGSKIYSPPFTMDLAYTADAFKSMTIEKVEDKPTPEKYASGNALLDKARYDAALKNWYFTFYRKDYYLLYDPSGYDAYMKALEDAGNHPEAGH